ncbi:MAG: tetratricopeptide repeat protein [Solirubrobacterales bacterium]|nr:tetratricopeptide repeat protein [Solirubrobacterales bacterium]
MSNGLPSGVVTFLFTDIEGSTALLRELGSVYYRAALAEHRRVVREAIAKHLGIEMGTEGDAFFVVFSDAAAAVAAAQDAQRALGNGPIRVRMGLHTGSPLLGPEGYVGEDVHLGARIAAAGHGGQVLLSAATRASVDVQVTDLGEHRLKDFPEPVSIFQLGSERFPPLKTISNTNLPRPASSFVGRAREVEELVTLVRSGARLVTLFGPGGSGKSRLAIEAASELLPAFKAGVFWVGLAALRDPALVIATVAQTLGAKGDLADHIGEREMLLVLDNLEQVVAAAPELATVLERCPNLHLLVTSRELLRVRGEVDYPVDPLAESDAVALFCVRAQTKPDEGTIELCRRLDYLPLAIELAAARASVLSAGQMLERLSQRLDLLKGGRDADPRQQTLRATIAWSHELLSELERRLFARLAVFAGGCALEAAETVCEADLDQLQSLVEKSLVRHSDRRFWMLETIREYAGERLRASGEASAIARRQLEFLLALAEPANLFAEAEGAQRHDLVIPEHDNMRVAIERALEDGELELGFRLAVALENFWVTVNPEEGMQLFRRLLEAGGGVAPPLRARALRAFGGSTQAAGNLEVAQRLYEQSLAIYRELHDERGIAILLHRLGLVALSLDEVAKARPLVEQALEKVKADGSRRGETQTIGALGYVARAEGNLALAKSLFEQSARMSAEIGRTWWGVRMHAELAELALEANDCGDAARHARQMLTLAAPIEDRQAVLYGLAYLACTAALTGNSGRAGRLWGALEAEEAQAPLGPWGSERERYERLIKERAPEAHVFESQRRNGRLHTLEEAIELALKD